jgi:hypothetical protein
MKTALKCKNDEFLVMPLKQWEIAHQNSHKHKNDEFLVMPVK